MSVLWHPTYECDGCGFKEEGKVSSKRTYETPPIWVSKPDGWLRSYGYDLCPKCSFEHQVGVVANRAVNNMIYRAIHATVGDEATAYRPVREFLWSNERVPTYGPVCLLVNRLRKKHGLSPHKFATLQARLWGYDEDGQKIAKEEDR